MYGLNALLKYNKNSMNMYQATLRNIYQEEFFIYAKQMSVCNLHNTCIP